MYCLHGDNCVRVLLCYLQTFPVQNVIRRAATPYRYPGDSVSQFSTLTKHHNRMGFATGIAND